MKLAMLGVCLMLHPDPSGSGTHEQLHLPACSMLLHTGWPCPTCGLTTSMTAMAHGQVGAALTAQPFGAVLLVCVVLLGAAGAAECALGRSILHRLHPRVWWLWAALIGLGLGWAFKAALGWASGKYGLN